MSTPLVLSHIALWVLVLLQGFILLGLVRTVHQSGRGGAGAAAPASEPRAAERLAGELAPRIDAVDIHGSPVNSDDFVGALRAVLFVSPNCPNCMVTLDELDALQTKAPGTVVAVCVADTEECRQMAEDLKVTVGVVADPDGELMKSYDVAMTPTAVLVNRRGRIVQYGHPGRDELDMDEVYRKHAEAEHEHR